MQSGRPVWNSDMDSFGTMGTNGVFLGINSETSIMPLPNFSILIRLGY
jgi:hypothetical protein